METPWSSHGALGPPWTRHEPTMVIPWPHHGVVSSTMKIPCGSHGVKISRVLYTSYQKRKL